MTDNTLAKARAAVERLSEVESRAMEGPWSVARKDGGPGRVVLGRGMEATDGHGAHWPIIAVPPMPADAVFIARMRNAAPALLRLAEAVGDDLQARQDVRGLLHVMSHGATDEAIEASRKHSAAVAVMVRAEAAIDAALADLAALGGEVG